MANAARCRLHGGASLVGPAHPNWKHGRHSKWLPKGLATKYAAAIGDPNLVAVRDEIALVDVRVGELLESIGSTGNTKLWREARSRFDAFKRAGGKGKGAVGEARAALQQLDDLLTAGLSAAATWDELRETIDLRRKLSETETKRLKDLHQMISAERALVLMNALIDVVRTHVTDRSTLAAITDGYRRLVGVSGDPTPAT